ncbi:MAG: CvpA family protein [Bacilli bacterium]
MNFVDIIILVLILYSGLSGFRKGIINSVVVLIGTLLIFILAFYLKNPISVLLYENFPFFTLGGKFAGITVFNILIYEGISYLITILGLTFILKIFIKITGAVSGIVNNTLILGFPSKVLGAIIGLVQGYIIAFVVIFILSLVTSTSNKVNESDYGNMLLENTPLLSEIVGDTYNSITEIYQICTKYENETNKDEANLRSLDVLLKYEILDIKSAEKLIETEKIIIPGAENIIIKYKENL